MSCSLLQPLREIPLAFLDVETTGASADFGHRIIELGIVRIEAGRVVGDPGLITKPMNRHVQMTLADIDAGDLRANFVLLHRPNLVASDPIVPATIRVSETPTVIQLPHSLSGSGVRTIPPSAVRLACHRQADVPETFHKIPSLQQTRWRAMPYRIA